MPGTYALLIRRDAPSEIAVGALGEHPVPTGWYAYAGSAFGPGEFSRVERHYRSAAGDTDPHWHIDYLLAAPGNRLDAVVAAETDAECELARALPDGPVPGFGASDCSCETHLGHAPDRETLLDAASETLSAALRDDGERAHGADE